MLRRRTLCQRWRSGILPVRCQPLGYSPPGRARPRRCARSPPNAFPAFQSRSWACRQPPRSRVRTLGENVPRAQSVNPGDLAPNTSSSCFTVDPEEKERQRRNISEGYRKYLWPAYARASRRTRAAAVPPPLQALAPERSYREAASRSVSRRLPRTLRHRDTLLRRRPAGPDGSGVRTPPT